MTSDNTDHPTAQAQRQPQPDAEALSALFDDQLRDDAGRFAIRRLDHDARWRDACGRWQLAGDVLRRQPVGAAPRGFAERVASAVASERDAEGRDDPAAAVVPAAARRAPGGRRSWVTGGALAASVAVAALLVVRPTFDESANPAAADDSPAAAVATAAGSTSAGSSAAGSTAARPTPARSTPPASVQADSPAAVASVPQVPAQTSARRIAAPARVAASSGGSAPTVAAAQGGGEAGSRHPFRPQAGEIVSRPWPRAVLPDYPATGAFTVSYDAGPGDRAAPSFYPFEPRVPAAVQTPESIIQARQLIRARQLIEARSRPASEGPRR